ncbi:MAG: dipeptidyl-peptidase-4 [Planctomycetota bacterium]|jgi:dipeptidyl-peptidase-4
MNRLFAALLSLFLISPFGLAQEPSVVSVPWMNGYDAYLISATASTSWLDNGDLLYYQPTREGLQDGVQRINPSSGKVLESLSLVKAAQSMASIDPKAAISWFPDDFDGTGRWALWTVNDDLWACAMPSGKVTRLTKTQAVEKSARFSPDGNKLAFIRGSDLYFSDLKTAKETRLTEGGTDVILNGTLPWVYWEEIFGRADLGYWWSPDSKQLVYLRSDETEVGVIPYIEWKNPYPTVKNQRYPRTGTTNPSVEVRVIGAEAGALPKIVKLAGDKDSKEYIVRVSWLPSGSGLLIQTMNRAQNKITVHRVNLTSAGTDGKYSSTILFEEVDPGWVHPHDDLLVSPDEKHILWISERSGYAHLYHYDITGKLLSQITKGDFALRDSGVVYWLRQAIKSVDWHNSIAYVSSLKKSSIENQLYRVDLKTGEMTRVSQGDGTHAISFNKQSSAYVDEYSRASLAPQLALHRPDGSVIKVLTAAKMEAAEAHRLQYPEFFTIPTKDGFEMPAYIMKPKNFDPKKKYPVITYGYGGPSAPKVSDSWMGRDILWNNLLLENGFLVFCVDNRSAAAISKVAENSLLNEMYGPSVLNDLLDGIAWLKKQPFVDGDRVGLWGWSGGGSLTLLGMTGSKEFKAGVAVAGVSRWQYYDTLWAESSIKRPQDNPEGYRACDLVAKAGKLSGKLLLVHGTADDNVQVQNTYSFVDALIRNNILFEMLIYPNRKHGISDRPAQIHLFSSMLSFWKRNLRD